MRAQASEIADTPLEIAERMVRAIEHQHADAVRNDERVRTVALEDALRVAVMEANRAGVHVWSSVL